MATVTDSFLPIALSSSVFTLEEFRQAVAYALEFSDGYVWLYTQMLGLFPPSGIVPAYLEAIARARQDVR